MNPLLHGNSSTDCLLCLGLGRLFETVDCGAEGNLRLLQSEAEKSLGFWGEDSGRSGGRKCPVSVCVVGVV